MTKDDHTPPLLRIAVISDLHAYVPSAEEIKYKPTLKADTEGDGPLSNPVAALCKLIDECDLRCDAVLCPGDLGNQADPTAIRYAWRVLHDLSRKLGASVCVAATGNHDLDSRHVYQEFDPLECLKKLDPRYPVQSELECFRYWSHHFSIEEGPNLRVVLLNSSAFHWTGEAEWNRGRVSVATIEWLEAELRKRRAFKGVNILLCHHHPHRHPEIRIKDASFDVMVDGNLLTDALGTGEWGDWLIIHGHKHHPMVSYAAGSSQSPVVFSAGSFSGPLYEELGSIARNQFYLVEIPTGIVGAVGMVGTIRAWTWAHGKGWVPAEGEREGLPAKCDFGCREAPRSIANNVVRWLGSQSYKEWHELLGDFPQYAYLMPSDFVRIRQILAEQHRISIEMNGDVPAQVGRVDQ